MAVTALIISLTAFAWTVVWSVYEYRRRNRREIRVRAWFGMTIGPPGKEGIDSIDLSAVNVGRVPVTLRVANARIIGDQQFAIPEWMHQEPKSLGSRAVVHPGETWVGLIDVNVFAARVERVATTPPPWRVVFGVADADDNRYELAEQEALEFDPRHW